MLHDLAGKLLARARQVTQFLNRGRRHEAGTNQPVRQQVRDPGSVVHLALASRHVMDMRGVGQHQLKVGFQHMPYRLPVNPGRLHRHVRTTCLPQPIQQR